MNIYDACMLIRTTLSVEEYLHKILEDTSILFYYKNKDNELEHK